MNTNIHKHTHTHTTHSTIHKCVIKTAGYGTIHQYTIKQIYIVKYFKHFTNKTNLDILLENKNGNIVRVGIVVTPHSLIVTNSKL